MHLLMINPPHYYHRFQYPFIAFPLGLGYLASALRNLARLDILDCVAEAPNKKTGWQNGYLLGLSNFPRNLTTRPDAVLIGCNISSQWPVVKMIAKHAKSMGCKVVLGGNYISANPSIIQEKYVDVVVVGESDAAASQIICALKSGGKRLLRPRRMQLDRIPFPAYDLFPMEPYLSSRYKHSLLKSNEATAPLVTSRGCPNGCSYCAASVVSGKLWRPRAVQNVIAEIRFLKEKYCVKEIHFEDDNLLHDKKRFANLCVRMKSLGVRWTMPNGLEVQKVDCSLLDLMKDSGCFAVFLAVESTNPKVLDTHIKKKIDPKHVKQIIRHARRIGLYTVGFFMFGFYEEDMKDIQNTVDLAISLSPDEAHFSTVQMAPGSVYYARHKHLLKNSWETRIDNRYLKYSEIWHAKVSAYISFELNRLLKNPLSYLNFNHLQRVIRYAGYITHKEVYRGSYG
ncbi:MAG: radical SAM protein [Candidatus Woesearchaeota archaeon]